MAGFSGSLGSLWVEIGARIDGLLKGLSEAQTATGNTAKQMEALASIGESFSDVGKKLTLGVTVPMVAFGAVALKASGDFDSAMRIVSARGEITGGDLEKLKKQAEDLGAATKFSSRQAAEGMEELAGAGFKTQEIYAAMPGIMNFAAASMSSVGDAAKVTKDVMGQFGLAAEQTGHVVDVMTAAGMESSGSLTELATTLKYVGPNAKAAGLSIEQTSAAIIALDKAGIRGSSAGTALRTILLNLQAPSEKAAQAMENLGITIVNTSTGALLPLPQIINNINAGLAKLDGPASKAAVAVELFGKNAVSAGQALLSGGGQALTDYEAKVTNVGGTTTRVAEQMNAGFGGAMEKMKGSIETASQKIGDLMAPAAIQIAGLVETAANKVADFARNFDKLPGPIQAAVIGLTGFAAVLGPALGMAGQMLQAIASLNLALPLLAKVLQAVQIATGLTATAIAAATVGILAAAAAIGVIIVKYNQWKDAEAGAAKALDDQSIALTRLERYLTDHGKSIANLKDEYKRGQITFLEYQQGLQKLAKELGDTQKKGEAQATTTKTVTKVTQAAGQELITYQQAMAKAGKETEAHASKIKPLSENLWALSQRFDMEQSAIKKSGEEAIKWLAAHKTIESQTPKLTQVTDELNDSIVLLIQNEKLVAPAFLDAGKQAENAMAGLAKQTKELAAARKEAGIADIDLMKKQADAAEENYDRIAAAASSSSEDIQQALDAWQQKQAAVIFEEGGKLPDEYQRQLDVFANKTEVAGEKQKDLWSGMMKQVSTIISDAGKSIVDKLFNMGEYNAKLDEQAAGLRDNLAEREQAYNDFAQATQTSLADAEATYQETLAKSAEDLKQNLADRQKDYEDFANEVAGKFDDIRASHAKAADKERQDVQDSLSDRTQDYEDFVGDINDKRAKIRTDSIKSETKERKALQDSLADKKTDYDRYVEDVAIKVKRIRDKNKGQYSEEEADLVKSLQRRTEDFNAFQAENLANQSGLAQKYAADQAAEEADLQKSLDRKTRDFEEYKADVAKKLDEISVKHQEAQAKEEADLQTSLDKKRAALDQYTTDAIAKAEEVNAKAAEKLESQKSTLEAKLADQLAAWDKYKTDVGEKLQEIEDKHRTVLGNIAQVGIDVFKELGGAVARFVSEFLIGQLFKQLATLTDDIFPSLGKAMEKVFGKAATTASDVASEASTAGEAISGGAQQAGGAAQTAAGGAMQAGIMGLTNMISGLVTAVTGVIGVFQSAHQETSLNAIEHNTRYSMMYLGERGDGGILGRLFDIADKTQWVPGLLDAINLKMDTWLQPLNGTLQMISGQIETGNNRLGEISTSTMWGSKPEQEHSFKFDAMLAELRNIAAKNLSVTVNVTGAPGSTTSNVKLAGLNAI
jgi:TP901 family phage tail tape measure protein